MIFTVFQYIPLIEEETPGHRVELAKKEKQSDATDGDSDSADDDCDDDTEEDLGYLASTPYHSFYSSQKLLYITGDHFYKYLTENINTPPPKV